MLYTSCIPGEYMYEVVCIMYRLWRDVHHTYTRCIRFVYVKPMWQCQHMQCVHGVQSINAVKGVDIRVRSCTNEIKWDEYTSECHPHDINPVICWNSSNMQYKPGVYTCWISGQHVPVCCIPVKYSIPRRCNAHKLCIPFVYIKKKNLKIKRGNKQSYSNATYNAKYEWIAYVYTKNGVHITCSLSVYVYARTNCV